MSAVQRVHTPRSGDWNPEELVHVYDGKSNPTLPVSPSGHLVQYLCESRVKIKPE